MAEVPALRFTDLEQLVPGLVAGITVRRDLPGAESRRGGELDFGLSTGGDMSSLSRRYSGLATGLGFESAVAVRQVHGSRLVMVEGPPPAGFRVLDEADGIVTRLAGLLLAVTVADCVPVFVMSPGAGTLALLHAGWRGTAGGVLPAGIQSVVSKAACAAADLVVYLGPAICGACYEVGPEVTGEFADPGRVPGHLDLRHVLAGQAAAAGVRPESVLSSVECTLCCSRRFHSHRGHGEKGGRMAAFVGRRA